MTLQETSVIGFRWRSLWIRVGGRRPAIIYQYHIVQHLEQVGPHAFVVAGLRDFDEAVDGLFQALEADGEGERLHELCPFFGKLWPSARGLARHLTGPLTAWLPGRSVLEVGCGLALPSLAAAKLGAEVTASDFHPEVEAFLARNCRLNGMQPLNYKAADWRDPATDLGRFDLVIGSDVLYDRTHPADLIRFIRRHLAPGGRAVIADPGRAWLQGFATGMDAAGFASDVGVAVVDEHEIFLLCFDA